MTNVPTYTVHIELQNAAFENDARPEIARLLRAVAYDLEHGMGLENVRLRDLNGNAVGSAGLYNLPSVVEAGKATS